MDISRCITDCIKPELIILAPVLYLIGIGIKRSQIPDKYIPTILGVVGVLLSALWVFSTTTIAGTRPLLGAIFVSITQGVLVAGGSVYAHQLFKQGAKTE